MSSEQWKLDELASRAGVSPRTVRYYIQRNLVPPPQFRGPDTAYGEIHLHALRAIQALQRAYWPLDAIAQAVASKSAAELAAIANGALPPRADDPVVEPPVVRKPSVARKSAAAPVDRPQRFERWLLAPGLELSLAEDASDDVRAWATEIRRWANGRG